MDICLISDSFHANSEVLYLDFSYKGGAGYVTPCKGHTNSCLMYRPHKFKRTKKCKEMNSVVSICYIPSIYATQCCPLPSHSLECPS